MTHRSVEVPVVARVEGEGALHVRIDDGEITRLELEIYEPPRFFESFLRGRHFSEVPDIVPRICGICPVAYQMTAIHGLERHQVDVSWWTIRGLERLGLVRDVKRPTPERLARRALQTPRSA